MLAVEEKIPDKITFDKKSKQRKKLNDIIVLKEEQDIIEYNTNGDKIIRKAYKKVNITKLVNETKKLLKIDNSKEKLEELKKAMSEVINK